MNLGPEFPKCKNYIHTSYIKNEHTLDRILEYKDSAMFGA